MSELPNLIWVHPAEDDAPLSGLYGCWTERVYRDLDKATPYVPASELEQAQDKLAEYGEEIARLRDQAAEYRAACEIYKVASETALEAAHMFKEKYEQLINEKPPVIQ